LARELGRIVSSSASAKLILIAQKNRSGCRRWVCAGCSATSRSIPDATIEEAALAASCLVALPGAGYGADAEGHGRKSD
jgi:hypothetical protein